MPPPFSVPELSDPQRDVSPGCQRSDQGQLLIACGLFPLSPKNICVQRRVLSE